MKKSGWTRQRLEAIRAISSSRMFVVVTDKEAILAADFGKNLDGIMAITAVKSIRSKLDELLREYGEKPLPHSRGKPKDKAI